jgi:hypothetical protein
LRSRPNVDELVAVVEFWIVQGGAEFTAEVITRTRGSIDLLLFS